MDLALRTAATWPEAFVPDLQGSGTTLYTAAPGAAFRPGFGPDSRRRHAGGGAAELLMPGVTGLRRDVDTPEDRRVTCHGSGWGPARPRSLRSCSAPPAEATERGWFRLRPGADCRQM